MCLSRILNVIPFLIMGHKAFPQVYSVLGVTPVYEWMGEGSVSSHIFLLITLPQLHPQGVICSGKCEGSAPSCGQSRNAATTRIVFFSPIALAFILQRRSGNFTCRYTIYEASYNLHRLKIAETDNKFTCREDLSLRVRGSRIEISQGVS